MALASSKVTLKHHFQFFSLSVSYTPNNITICLIVIVVIAIGKIDSPRRRTIIGIRAKLVLHLILFCKNVTKAFYNTLW